MKTDKQIGSAAIRLSAIYPLLSHTRHIWNGGSFAGDCDVVAIEAGEGSESPIGDKDWSNPQDWTSLRTDCGSRKPMDELHTECLACNLIDGTLDLPGGRIHTTSHWVVEHCIGPFEVGTLIVKPFRHCVHFWELTDRESQELGPLLRQVTATIETILKPDQVYICLWSHADWRPGHLHFVLQPSWNSLQMDHQRPGPFLQMDMMEAGMLPAPREVEAFAAKAREVLQNLEKTA